MQMAWLLLEKQWKSVLIISHSLHWCKRDPTLNNTRRFTRDTLRWIRETGNSQSHMLRAWATQNHVGLHSGAGGSQPELWVKGFVVMGEGGDMAPVPAGGCDLLVGIIVWADRDLKPVGFRTEWVRLVWLKGTHVC